MSSDLSPETSPARRDQNLIVVPAEAHASMPTRHAPISLPFAPLLCMVSPGSPRSWASRPVHTLIRNFPNFNEVWIGERCDKKKQAGYHSATPPRLNTLRATIMRVPLPDKCLARYWCPLCLRQQHRPAIISRDTRWCPARTSSAFHFSCLRLSGMDQAKGKRPPQGHTHRQRAKSVHSS